MDRDIIIAMNISRKLSPRFKDSRGDIDEAKSDTFKQVVSEPCIPVIRIVDMSKSSDRKNTSC